MSAYKKALKNVTVKVRTVNQRITDDIKEALIDADISEVGEITDGIFNKYNIPKYYRNTLYDAAMGAAGLKTDVIPFRKFYKESISIDGELLSKKINDVSRTGEIKQAIEQAKTVEGSWQTFSRNVVRDGLTKGELPGYMSDLLSAARKGAHLSADTQAYKEYQRALAKAESNIGKLLDANDTSKLARAYRDIAELTKGASEQMVKNAVDRAVMQKARANATRLLRTETARSYGNTRIAKIQQDDDATGIRWELSEQHDHYCICDFFAEADMFDMGAGVYPKNEVPDYPAHPYCSCSLIPVYDGEVGKYNDESAKAAFDELDESEQKALAGKSASWDDMDWEDHKVPKLMQEAVSE